MRFILSSVVISTIGCFVVLGMYPRQLYGREIFNHELTKHHQVVTPKSSAGSADERLQLYTNQFYGWSVSYPRGWTVDDSHPRFVVFKHGRVGRLAIYTATAKSRDPFIGYVTVKGKSLDEIADIVVSAWRRGMTNRYVTNLDVRSRFPVE